VSALVLEAHLNNDVTAVLRDAQQSERERVVTDLLAVFNRIQGNAPAFPDPVSSTERTAQRLDWLGQVEAYVQDIQGLLSADARPVDVLTAIADVQAMLEAFQNRVLAEHLNGCVTTAIRSQQATERERVVRELLQVFDATSRM
jgi:DNA-binding FrmR family transcriptional regulator